MNNNYLDKKIKVLAVKADLKEEQDKIVKQKST